MRKLMVCLLVVFMSCCKSRTIHLYSLDESQCITIIDRGDTRYIIDGKYSKVPQSNYVKLDVGEIDPIRDAIYLCWRTNEYEWDLVSNLSIVIESKLDTTKFKFDNNLPEDERGIPNQKKFSKEYCAVFDYYSMKLIPNKGAIVEID